MTKREKIKKLVAAYAQNFGVGSHGFKYIYIHQDTIINRIDRSWYKSMIDDKYNNFINGKENIGSIINLLNREIIK